MFLKEILMPREIIEKIRFRVTIFVEHFQVQKVAVVAFMIADKANATREEVRRCRGYEPAEFLKYTR
jgi:hypothetical protein